MIKIIAEFDMKPDRVSEAVQLAEELVAETRKEAGCISYELFQDTDRANHLIFLEEWESQAVLDRHSASEHFTRIVPQIAALGEREPRICTYTKLL